MHTQVSVYTCDTNLKSYFRIFSADFDFAVLLLLLCNPSPTLSGIVLVLVISLDSLLSPSLLDFCPPYSLIFSRKSCNSLITDFSFFPPPQVHIEFHGCPKRKGHISSGHRQLFVSTSARCSCLFSLLTVLYGSLQLIPPASFPTGRNGSSWISRRRLDFLSWMWTSYSGRKW